jgi:hypothetical protein
LSFSSVVAFSLSSCYNDKPNLYVDKEDSAQAEIVFYDNKTGFSYILNKDGGAEIYSYAYNSIFSDIDIPSSINNLDVVGITNGAFSNSTINTFTLPSSLQKIDHKAFDNSKISKLVFDAKPNLDMK